ncbi:MAG: hypothetical protein DWQ10_08635 [Calditrichaeota bacterium]|nr:MAG: hypothetical protein DWQ10_08635 [Calditrichota bacterium]
MFFPFTHNVWNFGTKIMIKSQPVQRKTANGNASRANNTDRPNGKSLAPPEIGLNIFPKTTAETPGKREKQAKKPPSQKKGTKDNETGSPDQETQKKAPTDPAEDAGFVHVIKQVGRKAKIDKVPPKKPEVKQDEVEQAATLPADQLKEEQDSKQHLQEMESVKTEYTVDDFMAKFRESTQKVAKSLPDTKNQNNSVQALTAFGIQKTTATLGLAEHTLSFRKPLQEKLEKNTSRIQEDINRPSTELKVDPAGNRQIIRNTSPAVPKPKTDSEISLDDKSKSLDDALKGHNINGQSVNIEDRMLTFEYSGEKEFDEAGKAKRKAQDEIQKVNPRYREQEQQEINNSKAQINAIVSTGLGRFNKSRGNSLESVFGKQKTHKDSIEKEKSKSHIELQKVYLSAKEDVEAELDKLNNIEEKFDTVLSDAEKYFRDWVHQDLEYIYTPGIFDYSDWIDKRSDAVQAEYNALLAKKYNKIDTEVEQISKESEALGWIAKGFGGVSKMGGDMFLYQKAVKTIQDRDSLALFKKAKAKFVSDVYEGARLIAKEVVGVLNKAKTIIKEKLKELDKVYSSLSEKEQEELGAAFEGIKTQFGLLGDSVEDRKREIISDMSRSYKKGVGKLKSTFDTIKKDVLTSWFEKAWNKVKAVVEAIINFAKRIIELLGRLVHLVDDIISSPRYFFNNLVDGIGMGFKTFVANIEENLGTAFFDWLRGKSGMLVQLPKDWNPKSIFFLFTQLLGLTTETIWKRMDVIYNKKIANVFRKGEEFFDEALEIFNVVQKDGIAGLWNYIKDSLGNILNETLKMIKENVLYAAIKKIIFEIAKLLVPGGGFLAIAEKVIRFLQFIVEARDKILDLIESFVDSVEMAVNGNIPGIVKHLNAALRKFITIALDFLVGFFGLRSLKEKVERMIKRMRKPIIRGIDWILKKLKPIVYKVFRGISKGKKKLIEVKEKIVSWWNARKKFKDEKGESHTLRFKGEGAKAYLIINPNPVLLQDKIKNLEENYKESKAVLQIKIIKTNASAIDSLKTKTDKKSGKTTKTSSMSQETGKKIQQHFNKIAAALENDAFRGKESVPPTLVNFPETKSVLGDYFGMKMVAKPLSINAGGNSGSEPQTSGESNLWQKVRERKNAYVQGHLLNHNLHGSGAKKENLVPITRTLNNPEMLRYESKVKTAVLEENKVVSYSVDAHFGEHPSSRTFKNLPEEQYLPSAITMNAKFMDVRDKKADRRKPDNWIEKKSLVSITLPHKLPEDTPLDSPKKHLFQLGINGKDDNTKEGLKKITYIGDILAERIMNGGPYLKFSDLTKVHGVGEGIIEQLKNEKNPDGDTLVKISNNTLWK